MLNVDKIEDKIEDKDEAVAKEEAVGEVEEEEDAMGRMAEQMRM